MFGTEKGEAFSQSLAFIRFVLALPKNMKTNVTFFVKFWVMSILAFVICGALPLHHLITTIIDKTGVDISEDISVFLGCTGALATSYLFVAQLENWIKFIADITSFDSYDKPSSFETVKKRTNLFSLVYSFYLILATLIYGTISYISTGDCIGLNEKKGLHELCGSFVPIKPPFNASSLMIRELIFLTQMVLFFFSLMPGAMICFMTYESTEMVLTHVQHLKQYFTNVFNTSGREERSKRVRLCVNYHNHILSLSSRLNLLVKYTIGHMSLIAAIVFASIGNQIFKATKPLAAVLYLIGYVVSLFMICHAGQQLTDEVMSINYAVYDSKWYEADAKTMKDILFILMRSHKPVTLDALPLGALNYPLFLMIFKTSYSYLTLLNQST
nr:odorant receptor [Semanotus bifasciatus]